MSSLRTKLAPGRLILGAVGLSLGMFGVFALREATLSTHGEEVGPRIELVVSASTSHREPGQTRDEMVEAQILACRLEVSSDVVGPIEPLGDGRYRATLAPSMDETNRKQFRGCLRDWRIDGLRLNVLHLDEPTHPTADLDDEPDDD